MTMEIPLDMLYVLPLRPRTSCFGQMTTQDLSSSARQSFPKSLWRGWRRRLQLEFGKRMGRCEGETLGICSGIWLAGNSMIITILVGMLIFDPSFFGVDHRKDLAGLVVNYLHWELENLLHLVESATWYWSWFKGSLSNWCILLVYFSALWL